MSETWDVVVVGSGLAGLAAGNRAAEQGFKTVVLEQGDGEAYLCNSRITMGFFQIALQDIGSGAAALRQAIDRATRGHVAPALADAFASSAGPAIQWLQAQGIKLVRGGENPSDSSQLAPQVPWKPGLHWRGRGGDVMLRRLADTLRARGGELQRGMRARELIIERGRCTGVVATASEATHRFEARAVVIADGGFQANADLVRRHISPRPDRLLTRNAGTGRGDGLLMGEAAGAATLEMSRFYGHVQARDAMTREGLWPYPTIDLPISAAIAVTGNGRRFTDEGLGGIAVANAIARLPDPLDTFAVFDQAAWEASGKIYLVSANPYLEDLGVTFHRAGSLDELAARAGLPVEPLAATVAGFNRAVAEHALDRLDPPRSEESGTPWGSRPIPILRAPFYAVPLCAGITYTMGGLAIDPDARVLAKTGAPIPGLYAAGGSIGGTEGGPVTGYTGGLAKALVFGWRAGNAIARDRDR